MHSNAERGTGSFLETKYSGPGKVENKYSGLHLLKNRFSDLSPDTQYS